MRIYIYHSVIKHTTGHGKYKLLKNAMKKAIEVKNYWKRENIDWMRIYIGE